MHTAQGESKFSCVFCHQKYKPQHCKIVTKIETRKSILRKKGKCFLCLRDGHVLRNCTQSFTCFKCEGKLHISICDEEKRTRDHSSKNIQKQSPSTAEIETQTSLNGTPCNVLPQTGVANVYVSDKSENRAFRLLFDSGTQLSYVSPKVKAFLNPGIKTKKEVVLKTFGENTSNKILEVVELVVAPGITDEDIKLQAFVTDICHPLKNQNTKFAKNNFSHIRNLTLADKNRLKSSDIDILIGSDYYWHFMKNRIIRGNVDEPVALETKLDVEN